jgi:hypothetical protein
MGQEIRGPKGPRPVRKVLADAFDRSHPGYYSNISHVVTRALIPARGALDRRTYSVA